MFDPTNVAAILVAGITAGATLWTQRGGARAQRKSAQLQERAQDLKEFQVLRDAALQDVIALRKEVDELRADVRAARGEAMQNALLLDLASGHIRVLRPLVPATVKMPPLPPLLETHGIGV